MITKMPLLPLFSLFVAAGCAPVLTWQFSPPSSFARPDPANYPEAAAVALNDDVRIAQYIRPMAGESFYQMQSHKAVAILTRDGQKYGAVRLQIPPKSSLVDFQARTILASGAVLAVDKAQIHQTQDEGKTGQGTAYQIFQFPRADVGSILELAYTVQSDGIATSRSGRVDQEIPVRSYTFGMTTHVDAVSHVANYDLRAYNMKLRDRQARKDGSDTLVSFSLSDIPAWHEEWLAPQWQLRSPMWSFRLTQLRIYTGRRDVTLLPPAETWADVAAPLARTLYNGDGATFAGLLSPVADSIRVASVACPDRRCLVERGLAWVQKLKTEPLWAWRQSRPLRDVLKAGSATPIEKTLLLWYWLRRADQTPQYALLARGLNRLIDPGFPTMENFNHLVLYLPGRLGLSGDNGQDWWLDPSCQECHAGEIPAWIAKHDGLVMDKTDGNNQVAVQFLPVTGTVRNLNRNEHRYQAVVGSTGELDVTIEAVASGGYALRRRIEQHAASPQFFVEEAQRQVAARLPTGKVVTQQATECDEHDGLCRRRVRFTAAEYATFDGDRVMVPLTLLSRDWDRVAESDKRFGDIQVANPTHDEESVTLKVPAGWVLAEAPQAEQRHSSAADAAFTVSCRGSDVVVRRTIDTREGIWERSGYEPIRQVVRAYAAVRQKVLVFRANQPAGSATCAEMATSSLP